MSVVSNVSDGATGRVFIAPNNTQPEGQSEVWINLGPFMKSSPLQEMNAPKYPASVLQSAGVSQAQFHRLLADISVHRCENGFHIGMPAAPHALYVAASDASAVSTSKW